LHLTTNLVYNAWTKHIEIDNHFVWENVALGSIVAHYVPSFSQVIDIFTKPFTRDRFVGL